jgi:hypothetical protein
MVSTGLQGDVIVPTHIKSDPLCRQPTDGSFIWTDNSIRFILPKVSSGRSSYTGMKKLSHNM